MNNNTTADRIPTRVGTLNVRQHGAGSVAVLWPSLFIDSSSWQRVEPALAGHRRLILIDGPGHGASGDPGRRYTMTDCAAAALEVIDALGVDGPVDWVGNAWGGHVGIVAASEWPDRLRTLVTLGTPVRAYRPAERRQVRLLAMAYRILGPARFLTDGVAEVQLSPATRANDPEAVALTTEFLRSSDRRRLHNAIQSISIHREELISRLPALRIPTLFITGSDHIGFTPDEARAAIALVPDGQTEIVSDAAYLIPLEQPERTAELVLDFWDRA